MFSDFAESANWAVYSLDLIVTVCAGSGFGTSSDEANTGNDERDAEPSPERDVLVEEELREQDHQDVAERSGGKNVSQVSKRKCREVRGEESDEHQNADDDPGIQQRGNQLWEVGEGDSTEVAHAAGERDVSAGGEDDYSGEDEVFAGSQKKQLATSN